MRKKERNAEICEKLSDEALSERLGQYQKQAHIWLCVGLLGLAGGVIAAVALRDAACKAVLVAVLFGGGLCCVLFLSGGAQKKLKSLMQEQLGDFFQAELKQAFGPQLHTPEMQIDRTLLEALPLLDGRWEECETERFYEGSYHGLHFAAANVRLNHVYEQGHGKGSLGTSRDMVFKGLVIRCETRVPAAPAFRASVRTEEGVCGTVTGDEELDRRFCVMAEQAQDASALLSPQFTEWLSAFEQSVEGRLSCFCWEKCVFTLVLETDYGFANVASNVDMRNLDAVRRSFCNSLREMEETLKLLLKNESLFTQKE